MFRTKAWITVLFCPVIAGAFLMDSSAASTHSTDASVAPLNIKWREDWNADPPVSKANLKEWPAPFVIVHHSATQSCSTEASCKRLVKSFQNYHMNTKHWDDIAYNFVIGEDGNIYEGRGWGIAGSHTSSYNSKSIGICITGNFTDHMPNQKALDALKNLINYGVSTEEIAADYKLIGHLQAKATECPGKTFYDALRNWDHWAPIKKR